MAVALVIALAGCDVADFTESPTPSVPLDATPTTLSGWHLLQIQDARLVPVNGSLLYDLNTPLFSDHAHKLRTVRLPPGKSANFRREGPFDFPAGTVFTKTFYYPVVDGGLQKVGLGNELIKGQLALGQVKLIETRILIHRDTGWEALPYVWNDAQSEAHLAIAGDIQRISLDGDEPFNYVVPTKNECASCHATDHTRGELLPIGPKARHLNKVSPDTADGASQPEGGQLRVWAAKGILTGLPDVSALPKAASWPPSTGESLDHQARTYLDINCGHCHNPVGPADTSGLFLHAQETSMRRLGVCKPPIAAGRGTGGRDVSIFPGDKDKSILYYRMLSRDPAVMMPELGRSLVHEQGAALIGRWIDQLPPGCGTLADWNPVVTN
ncbi:MAG: SO2930 family diheme c-type cytochrome [Pseudomonadales bacterium]